MSSRLPGRPPGNQSTTFGQKTAMSYASSVRGMVLVASILVPKFTHSFVWMYSIFTFHSMLSASGCTFQAHPWGTHGSDYGDSIRRLCRVYVRMSVESKHLFSLQHLALVCTLLFTLEWSLFCALGCAHWACLWAAQGSEYGASLWL